MRTTFLILTVHAACLYANAASVPDGGNDLVSSSAQSVAHAEGGGRTEKIQSPGESITEATRVTVAAATPDKPWSAYVTLPLDAGAVKKGDRLLVRYFARSITGAQGKATAKVQISGPTFEALGTSDSTRFGQAWQEIHQPLIAGRDAPAGKGEVTILLGDAIQTAEIADLRVLNYGPDFDFTKLPRPKVTYEGREADAAWRKTALARIAKIRMADHSAQLTDEAGKPLANTRVTVELARHDFGFGTCVTRQMLTRKDADGERYRDIVNRTCSRVVFENDLKPGSFPSSGEGRARMEESIAWLAENGISIRGHYLIQEAVDPWTRARLGDPEKLKREMFESVRERIEFMGSRVTEWDALNHPVAWGGAELLGTKGPPLDTLAMDLFQEARKLTDLPLIINEDQIFRPCPQQDKTFELLEKLKREGVRVDGLGNQAHFNSSFLPSPEEQLRITERFTAVVPKQVITEWDIVTNGDERLAADYLRDSLIACFSHPAYDGFLLWGFWEKSHWIPEAALWRKDWSAKPIADVWVEWTTKRFHTRRTLTTDASGRIGWRGFKGTYRASMGGRTTGPFRPGTPANPTQVKTGIMGSAN
jgi:GH35 family endo-1,4-beta-xylanase